jgi:hypothetical protein
MEVAVLPLVAELTDKPHHQAQMLANSAVALTEYLVLCSYRQPRAFCSVYGHTHTTAAQ